MMCFRKIVINCLFVLLISFDANFSYGTDWKECSSSGFKHKCWGTKKFPNGEVKKGIFLHGEFRHNQKIAIDVKVPISKNNDLKRPIKSDLAECPSTGYFNNCYGRLSWKNGSFYEGEWKNDKRNGKGVFYHANGKIEEGIWKDNLILYLKEIKKKYNKTTTASNQTKNSANRPLATVSDSTVCFNATITSGNTKIWNTKNDNFVGEANYRGLDCGVREINAIAKLDNLNLCKEVVWKNWYYNKLCKNNNCSDELKKRGLTIIKCAQLIENKTKLITSTPSATKTPLSTQLIKEKEKRLVEERKRKELERRLAALEKKQKELQSKFKTNIAKKPKIEKSWCLPQNEFQRNIPFHKFEDGIDCPENTIKITKQRALNIFLIKYNSYLDNIIKSNSICDDTFKNYKYLRELIKKNKNFKCSKEFIIVKKTLNEKDLSTKPKSEFPLKPTPINFPSVSVKRDDIAVIIGNANYKKQGKDIPNVNPAYADAEGIKQYFMKAKGVREGNIIYIKDATNAQLLSVFGNDKSHKGKLFNYIKPNKSNVYVYYAGHGAPGKEGDAYLVPTDTDSQTIEFTGYPLSTFYSNLGKLPAKSMTVILEACFSGGSQSGSLISKASPIIIQPKKTMIPENIKVIAAGSERQMASWEEDSSHSLFTKYFLKAMSGEGDSNKDGKVSDNELKDYLSDTMTYYARRYYGRDQKVQIHNGG